MNRELVEVLLSINQIDGITKGAICSTLPKRLCRVNCNVCPLGYTLGYTHVTINGNPHYLKHLIILKGGMKYEP